MEKVESTQEENCKRIEKDLTIEKEKAKVNKNTMEEVSEEFCKANLVTEIVEQRIKMEDNDNKQEIAKGIPWLIDSLT